MFILLNINFPRDKWHIMQQMVLSNLDWNMRTEKHLWSVRFGSESGEDDYIVQPEYGVSMFLVNLGIYL